MYKFQGISVSKQRFWELVGIAKDLGKLEKELDKEVNEKKAFTKELINVSIPRERKNNNLKGHSFCKKCGAKMVLSKNSFATFFRCSNLSCFFVEGVIK